MTNLSGVAAPKPPKRKREHVKVYPDGREVCNGGTREGRLHYEARTYDMDKRQHSKCAICGEWMTFPTFDHEIGRGFGGSLRDDRIEDADGNWKNAAVHLHCNVAKGSKRYAWVNGSYVPVPKKERA